MGNSIDNKKRPATHTAWAGLWGYVGGAAPKPLPKDRWPFGIPYWGKGNSIDIEKRPATHTAWAGLWGYAVLPFCSAAANVSGHCPVAAANVTGHWPADRAQGRPYGKSALLCLSFYAFRRRARRARWCRRRESGGVYGLRVRAHLRSAEAFRRTDRAGGRRSTRPRRRIRARL